ATCLREGGGCGRLTRAWRRWRSGWTTPRARSALMWCTSGWSRWALVAPTTPLANSGSCSQGEFQACEMAGLTAVEGVAVPPGVQTDQVEGDGLVDVFEAGVWRAAGAGGGGGGGCVGAGGGGCGWGGGGGVVGGRRGGGLRVA